MFLHNKRLQYTVRVGECNPGLANLMLEQFGGPQGELAAATRYFAQYLAEEEFSRYVGNTAEIAGLRPQQAASFEVEQGSSAGIG